MPPSMRAGSVSAVIRKTGDVVLLVGGPESARDSLRLDAMTAPLVGEVLARKRAVSSTGRRTLAGTPGTSVNVVRAIAKARTCAGEFAAEKMRSFSVAPS